MVGSLDLAAALLLAGAGLAKLVHPQPAATMLGRVWPRVRGFGPLAAAVRMIGAGEAGIAAAAIGVGDRLTAVLLGCCYLAFAAVSMRLLGRGQPASCGCFGRADSPVGAAHLALNVVCVGVAVAGVVRPAGPFGGLARHDWLVGVTGGVQAVLLAYLGYLCITALPALAAARRRLVETA